MVITPVYSDIFKGEIPTLDSLISDIPSETIISLLCMITAKLYSGKHTFELQKELFDFLTFRQTAKIKSVGCSGKKFKCDCVPFNHPLPKNPPEPMAILD